MLPQDKHHYEKAILTFPYQLVAGIKLAQDVKVDGDFSSAAICGMGASSLATEFIDALADTAFPFYPARGYFLPRSTTEQTLVIISSFSGNTEETLSCFAEAQVRKLKIIGLSKNGQLEKLCTKNKAPFVKYPEQLAGFQPRWGTGYSLAALTTVLQNCGLLENIVSQLKIAGEKLRPETWRAIGERLANKLIHKEPVIYGPARLGYLARFWQMNFNEDAKVNAAWNYFPEVNHYETTGYTQGADHRLVIMIRDPMDSDRIKQRQQITTQLLLEKEVPVEFVDLPQSDNAAFRLLSGLVISMWTSLYLSDLYHLDPAPTEMVEKLKKLLA